MPTDITDAELERMLEYCEKATPGEWKHYRNKLRPQFSAVINEVQAKGSDVAVVSWGGFDDSARPEKEHAQNAAFIAAARTDLPRVVAALREVRQELTQQTADARTLGQLLTAERKDHALTISTFRRQEAIWDQKFADLRDRMIEVVELKRDDAQRVFDTTANLKTADDAFARARTLEEILTALKAIDMGAAPADEKRPDVSYDFGYDGNCFYCRNKYCHARHDHLASIKEQNIFARSDDDMRKAGVIPLPATKPDTKVDAEFGYHHDK